MCYGVIDLLVGQARYILTVIADLPPIRVIIPHH